MAKKFEIFQVWIENPEAPDDNRLRLMKSVIKRSSKRISYTLISNYNYFKDIESVKWVDLRILVDEVHRRWPWIRERWGELPMNIRYDCIKFLWASKEPNSNALYVDSSLTFRKLSKELIVDGAPVFLKWHDSMKLIDHYLFYVNGHTDWMKKFCNHFMSGIKNKFLGGAPHISHNHVVRSLTRFNISNRVVKIDDGFVVRN